MRNVLYSNIRVEHIEQGQLFDLRVVLNKDYNPEPGSGIENIPFRDIVFSGGRVQPSRIYGFDEQRAVDGVTFINLVINGERVDSAETEQILINGLARNIVFAKE